MPGNVRGQQSLLPALPVNLGQTTVSHLTLPTSFSFETATEATPELPGPELRGGRTAGWGKVTPKETHRGAQNSIMLLDLCKDICSVKRQRSLTF